MGEVVCVYCTFLLFCCFSGGGVHCDVEQLLPIRGVACRGLAVKGWNHGVSGEVRVAPGISQYLGLGCFGIVEWPGQHCRCPRNLGGLCFHSLSSSRFSLQVLPSHWIGGMWLRIVYASHTMFEGIPGKCWRWKVAHRWYWVHLECRMFGISADRWTSTWMWWHDLVLGGTRWANLLVYLHRQGMQHDRRGICPSLFVGMANMGFRGWLRAIVAQVGQFALKLQMYAFIPSP